MNAWVTSAVVDEAVNKAIVLAGSLRRVLTAKKLAVLTTQTVSKNRRSELRKVFDLVVILEQDDCPNVWNMEDYAKVEGLSTLGAFNKCVYLAPNTLVLKNCDEILHKYGDFAAFGDNDELDSSVFVFTPSLSHSQALRNTVTSEDCKGAINIPFNEKNCAFAKCFNFWIQNIPNWEKLDEQYNAFLNLESGIPKSMGSAMTVVRFEGAHPLDLGREGDAKKWVELGAIEKFVAELCEKILSEDVTGSLNCQPEMYKNEPIAIVGLAFRLPGCNNVEEFWDLLDNGRDAITVLPKSRWAREHTNLAYEDQDRTVKAGFLTLPVDEFDAKFFGISAKEVELIDPQQRILHEVAWEALEDSLIDPFSLKGTQTGVFVGSYQDDFKDMVRGSIDVDSFRVYMGSSIGTGAARLSHFLEITGPCVATESGCSAAMVAVDMACKSLRNHDSNMALACGVNLILRPFNNDTFNFIFSPDGHCKTFDEGANGFGRAEGCAVLILKRLSDAVKDENNIWGLIRGSAITQEGLSKSLGTPTVHSESLAMELALKDADVDPLAVSYVEAHGTGTLVGDPVEIASITRAYSKGRSEPLVIGSVKTNVGHTESVSGITGIIKVLLAMRHEKIPKHLNFKQLNSAINLDEIPAKIPLEPITWCKNVGKPMIAGVSSFGITGTDGHAIIQEPPVLSIPKIYENDERPLHILKISAKSPESFQQLLESYEHIFNSKENDDGFANLAYSANIGRANFNHRTLIIAKDFKHAKEILENKSFKSADVQSTANPLCFLFTGQGSQHPTMAATLYKTSPIFRSTFNKCDHVLSKQHGINLREVLWGKSNGGCDLSRTLFSQTSIFCVEYCLLKLWESWGVKPDYVIGHSLGEFAAAVAAGALDFEDALMLVAKRSCLIDGLPQGKMLVIRADKQKVDEIIGEFKQTIHDFWVDYAAMNTTTQTVVAGDSIFITEFAKHCEGKGLKTTILAATHAFHSRHMDSMLEAYRRASQKVKPLKISKDAPVYISGMEGKVVGLESIDADYWVRHTRQPVNFMGACQVVQSEGCSLFLELGPQPVLSTLTMMNYEGQSVTCLPSIRRNEEDWVTMLGSLGNLYLSEWKGEIDWEGFDRYYKRSRVPAPFYPFNRKSIWPSLETELPTVHPLLGKVVPTTCDHSIYENKLTLNTHSFIKDHVIGNTVVFPGTAFLEMCLAGGHLSAQHSASSGIFKQPQNSIVLRSFKITSPLAFYDSKICRLQTSCKLETEEKDEICYSVRINRHVPSESGGIGEWVFHSSANFLPVPPPIKTEEHYKTAKLDIPSIQNSSQKYDIESFYKKLAILGLHFGPKFRSLEKGWQSDQGILFAVKMEDKDSQNYLIHPVVTDAMLQSALIWTTRDRPKLKFQVPVQIEELRWFHATTSPIVYIYCTTNEGRTSCVLLDDSGNHLAHMIGVDLMETSAKLVEETIHQQSIAMPKLWEDVWKPAPGPSQSAYDLKAICTKPFLQLNEEQKQSLTLANDVGETEIKFYKNLCNLTRLYFLNAMYELGWKPKQGIPFTVEDLFQLLPTPKEHFRKYIQFFLSYIVETGMLVADPEQVNKYCFEGILPTKADIDKGLQKVNGPEDSSRIEYQLAVEVGRNLPKILVGELDALQIIFPDDLKRPSANKYYSEVLEQQLQPVIKVWNDKLIFPMLKECYDVQSSNAAGPSPPVLRVLEVGAGTGSYTELLLSIMEAWDKPIEYHFTDISASFFNTAEKKSSKYSSRVIFKKLNIEEDVLAQGFCPKYFDVILAYEVIHVAKDIRKALRNLKCLLKPGGIFQISETTHADPLITQIFGLLEGYWQFEDLDFRPNHVCLSPEKWEQALKEINCDKVICTPVYNNVRGFILARLSPEPNSDFVISPIDKPKFSWIVFYHESNASVMELLRDKLVGVNRQVYPVKRPATCTESGMKELMKSVLHLATEEVDSLEGVVYLWGLSNDIATRDQSQISLPLINLTMEIMNQVHIPRLYVLTQGTAHVEGYEVTSPSGGTLHGMIKSIIAENVELPINSLDLSPDESAVSQIDTVFQDLWAADQHNKITAYRDGRRLCCKLVSAKVTCNEPLPLHSGSTRFQLQLPESRLISDLEFSGLGNYTLEENEVEVKTHAVGLNFRDILTVLKPTQAFENFKAVGVDFAGVVTNLGSKVAKVKVGDRVIGMNLESNNNTSLPSHMKIVDTLLIPIPPSVTFEEGATLPVIFSTAFHCLIELAKMKRGDTVLIHTASGGVGLCAIQLAQRVGAEVIATAGSKRKQNYLRNIGVKHIFHSRTTQFGKQILEMTNGNGVDIVLNSLTGEGFKEASLAALAKDGKFIEMSKLNVWSMKEVKMLRPDVYYQTVDLTMLDSSHRQQLLATLKEYLYADHIRPIPRERFDAVNIRGALNYMQKAKHIGKVVCVMPEMKMENSKITWATPLFNEFSTYLVTGGLGGIGFEVVKWMMRNGAKHIAIVSRSNPKSEVADQIETWNKQGKHVEAFAVDIGNYDQCQLVFQELQSPSRGFPQLRGVMHAAGVLADATLQNQTWNNFNLTYNPKVNGTWNLHDLTKELLLEHFVVFSSMAATVGTPGQSNHAASNCFEDSLVAYRRSNGLPGTTVNWSNWGETGVATEIDFPGIRPLTTTQGILALETFLKTQMSHLSVINVQSFEQAVKIFPQLKNYVEDKGLFGNEIATVNITSDEFWKNVDQAEDRPAKLSAFKHLIKSTLKNMLKMDQDEVIDDLHDFQSLGIDSLMMLELKNGLQNIFGSRLSPTANQLKDSSNTEEIANQLLSILQGEGDLHSKKPMA